jgi:hypothetical protein
MWSVEVNERRVWKLMRGPATSPRRGVALQSLEGLPSHVATGPHPRLTRGRLNTRTSRLTLDLTFFARVNSQILASPLTPPLRLHCSPAVLPVLASLTHSTAASILQIPVSIFRFLILLLTWPPSYHCTSLYTGPITAISTLSARSQESRR